MRRGRWSSRGPRSVDDGHRRGRRHGSRGRSDRTVVARTVVTALVAATVGTVVTVVRGRSSRRLVATGATVVTVDDGRSSRALVVVAGRSCYGRHDGRHRVRGRSTRPVVGAVNGRRDAGAPSRDRPCRPASPSVAGREDRAPGFCPTSRPSRPPRCGLWLSGGSRLLLGRGPAGLLGRAGRRLLGHCVFNSLDSSRLRLEP